MSVTPRKKPKHSMQEDLVDLVGYVTYINSKISNGPHARFFDFYLGLVDKEIRIVSFDSDIHSTLKPYLHKGIILSKLKESGEDFIYTDSSSFMEKTPPFAFVSSYPVNPTPVHNAVESKPLYSRITLEVKVSKIDDAGVSKDGLSFRSIQIHDNSVNEPRTLTLYGKLINEVTVDCSYTMSYITISKFNGQRVFKTTERSILTKIKKDKDTVKSLAQGVAEDLTGIIVSVSLKSLETTICCSQCKQPVEVSGSLCVFCHNCNEALSKSQLNKTGNVQLKVLDDKSKLRRTIECPFEKMEKFASCPVSDHDKMLMFLIDSKVVIKHLKGVVQTIKLQ